MFNESTTNALIEIIALGVAKGLASQKPWVKEDVPATEVSSAKETLQGVQGDEEEDPFTTEQMDLADKEAAEDAAKKARKSAAGKKAAATKRANKAAAAAKAAEEAEAAEAAAAAGQPEDDDDEFDELDDDGVEAEMTEQPPMDRKEFMDSLKREAGKHPNGDIEGRKLAAKLRTKLFEVDKFSELADKDFGPMISAFKKEVAAI